MDDAYWGGESRGGKRRYSAPGKTPFVVSDGLPCFSGVEESGCEHEAIVTGAGPDSVTLEAFTWVNTMIGNVMNSMHGSYHAIRERHLPRYLAEFSYRFNRRFKLEDMPRVLVMLQYGTRPCHIGC